MEANPYKPEKSLFTEADFDLMSWHDVPIHAFAFGPKAFELSFDIDYLYRWLDPLPGEKYYRFWIGPATLVFENVYATSIDTGAESGLIILEIQRDDGKPSTVHQSLTDWEWRFACVEGEFTFRSTGFRQNVRKPPILLSAQHLSLEQRGGYSFECPGR